ncbi:MAG: ribulose-phosphate 3-epimerase [Acholeplasmataceae bacterium]|nr:ribulose-phosphate 3-epimerase [Acholeplasmataceae bacterium]
MNKIAPSILACDFTHLYEEVKSIESADYMHVDVMDGHFVPNITMGPCIYKNLKGKVNLIFDVHLMITDPMKYAPNFIDAGSDILTFHYEAVKSHEKINELIDYIHERNVLAGISIKPGTDVKVLEPFLKKIDIILVMSVEPGFGGQTFMTNAIDKIKYLKEMKIKKGYHYEIEVDGGINKDTLIMCKNAGCEVFVAGTFIFKNSNRKELIEELKKL